MPVPERWTVYVCPVCRKQTHPGDGECPKDVRPGQFRPSHMYEVIPVEVMSVAEAERLIEAAASDAFRQALP